MFEARIAELNRFNEQNPVSYDKRTYTVDEIQDILGISRPTAYNLVKQGVFHSVRVPLKSPGGRCAKAGWAAPYPRPAPHAAARHGPAHGSPP